MRAGVLSICPRMGLPVPGMILAYAKHSANVSQERTEAIFPSIVKKGQVFFSRNSLHHTQAQVFLEPLCVCFTHLSSARLGP